jgi:hypothetical protein
MSIDTAIARFRGKQAEQFTTTATVTRNVGEPVTDDETGEVAQPTETVFSGECKIRPDSNRSSDDSETGETLIGKPDYEGKFPVDSDILRDDLIHVTASQHDAGLVGRWFVVRKVGFDEWQISRVAGIEEYLPPLLNGGS